MFGLFKRKAPNPGAGVQFAPGDYRAQNAELIKIQDNWLQIEKLWRDEAAEAANPTRKLECLELADAAKNFHAKSGGILCALGNPAVVAAPIFRVFRVISGQPCRHALRLASSCRR